MSNVRSPTMSRQIDLDGRPQQIDEAHIYYREVKTQNDIVVPDQETITSLSETDDINQLLAYIKNRKLRYPVPLEESSMTELPRNLCKQILDNSEDSDTVKFFLSLFCGDLKKRQREAGKYAMLIHLGSSFLLAHVRAEPGISIKEDVGEIELIRRFLDVDNLLSAAYFEQKNDSIVFSHFTDTGSDSFREFLGVSKKQYHYEKKNIQIVCYYQGKVGVECKFEFSNDEFENRWLTKGNIEINQDQLSIEGGRAHQIRHIRWGSQQYDSSRVFQSDFKEYSFSLQGQRRRYEELLDVPAVSNNSIFEESVEKTVDKRYQIELTHKDRETRIVEKGSLPDNVQVLYANKNIDLDSHFADHIFADMVNDVEISLYHPSSPPAANELTINNVTFLNVAEGGLSHELKQFLQQTHNHILNLNGETVSRCLNYVLLSMLEREVSQPYRHGLQQLISINSGMPRDQSVVSSKENEGGGLIEFKNRLDLEGDDPAATIVKRIKTEKKRFDEKVFLWGVTEQTRDLDGLRTQSWNDDRVTSIESLVNERLKGESIEYTDFVMQPLPLNGDGERWVIAGMLY